MDGYRAPRPELEDLVPYDAKDVRAEVVLASNENPRTCRGDLASSQRLRDFKFNRIGSDRGRAASSSPTRMGWAEVIVGMGVTTHLRLLLPEVDRRKISIRPHVPMYAIDAASTGTEIVSIPRDGDFS
jgi:histidinol-phosphate/aromatic aminotransferase/cobyric acid decarboxylase-like protein